MRLTSIRPQFVDFIPRELEEGILYISERYRTASHKCACGCRERVVTPLSPVDWQLQRENDLVTLRPSIGNWNYACRSHYWIRKNQIRWGKTLTLEEISLVQARDVADKAQYIEQLNRQRELESHRKRSGTGPVGEGLRPSWRAGLLRRVRRFFGI
jgi:hypothetical protein